MIDLGTRVRLAPKARLQFDRRSGRHILLYPERGLTLNPTAAEIAEMCRDEVAVGAIIERLSTASPDDARSRIEADVLAFLAALEDRGLLVLGAAE